MNSATTILSLIADGAIVVPVTDDDGFVLSLNAPSSTPMFAGAVGSSRGPCVQGDHCGEGWRTRSMRSGLGLVQRFDFEVLHSCRLDRRAGAPELEADD